jgi:hypothetical protein
MIHKQPTLSSTNASHNKIIFLVGHRWAHTYNPSYSGGRNEEDRAPKPTRTNIFKTPKSKKPTTKKKKKKKDRKTKKSLGLSPSPELSSSYFLFSDQPIIGIHPRPGQGTSCPGQAPPHREFWGPRSIQFHAQLEHSPGPKTWKSHVQVVPSPYPELFPDPSSQRRTTQSQGAGICWEVVNSGYTGWGGGPCMCLLRFP